MEGSVNGYDWLKTCFDCKSRQTSKAKINCGNYFSWKRLDQYMQKENLF